MFTDMSPYAKVFMFGLILGSFTGAFLTLLEIKGGDLYGNS
jgi:hypothetical protein